MTDRYEQAMQRHLKMTQTRIKKLFVRPRAVFAEQVVAVWVGGTVMEFPGQAWDVEMPLAPGPRVQIQVKCSGERAPFFPDKQMKETWGLLREPLRNRGGPPDYRELGPGFKCHVFVFARHTGNNINDGWRFYVLSRKKVRAGVRAHPIFEPTVDVAWLTRRQARACVDRELKRAVADVARESFPQLWPSSSR